MTPLERLKLRLGIKLEDDSQDALLSLRLADAEDTFRAHCRRTDIPPAAAGLVERMAEYLHTKPSSVTGESIKDMSMTYTSDWPPEMLRELNRYRRIGVL